MNASSTWLNLIALIDVVAARIRQWLVEHWPLVLLVLTAIQGWQGAVFGLVLGVMLI